MVRLNLLIISHDGEPQIGKTNQITIQLSVDGSPFSTTSLTVTEIGNGCYYVDIPDSSLTCQYNVLIRATCPDCQETLFEYQPDTSPISASELATAVWNYGDPVNVNDSRTGFRTLVGDSTHEAVPLSDITNNVWGRSSNDTNSRTLTTNIGQVVWNYGNSSTTPITDRTVLLSSLIVGADTIASEAYIDSAISSGGSGEDGGSSEEVIGALESIEDKIDALPTEIWGRQEGDSTSRTLTSVVDLGIASEELIKILLGQNENVGTVLNVKDIENYTTLSLAVTRDANNKIISIK